MCGTIKCDTIQWDTIQCDRIQCGIIQFDTKQCDYTVIQYDKILYIMNTCDTDNDNTMSYSSVSYLTIIIMSQSCILYE